MEYSVNHFPERNRFEALIEGSTAFVEYTIIDGIFDITGTFVPKELEGRGIASRLVSQAYDFAKEHNYSLKGSCSYAAVWLKRHPN